MSGNQGVGGPDLREGVALAAIPEGGVLAGHVGEDAVLLYRRGEDVTAVGATCTHYSGPLAEGLVVGDTVHCPWHHACFSLRSGQVLGPPALNPLPRWEVERSGDQVRVGAKLETEPYPSWGASQAGGPGRIVVVGFGAAGSSAVEALLREGWRARIDVVDPDPAAPYDRPNLSKDYLAGTAPEDWIPLRPAGWYEERGVTVHRTTATGIDPRERRVTLADGRELAYDALLLATGATPIALDLPEESGRAVASGAAAPAVLYLRSLADSRALIEAATRGSADQPGQAASRRAVVVGASFIGLEVAAALRTRGLVVDVVAPESVPLGRVLGEPLGERVRRLHEEHGVGFHLGHTVRARIGGGVLLDDGTELPADFVVVGVGVRPLVALAEAAGLAVDKGVVVDERLRASIPGIWAVGDIARYPDATTGDRIRVEHWVVAQRQGAAAARDMIGRGTPYREPAFFWSQHYDLPINYVGHAGPEDEMTVTGDVAAGDCAVAYTRGGRTTALATIFRDDESLRMEVSMERGTGEVAHG